MASEHREALPGPGKKNQNLNHLDRSIPQQARAVVDLGHLAGVGQQGWANLPSFARTMRQGSAQSVRFVRRTKYTAAPLQVMLPNGLQQHIAR